MTMGREHRNTYLYMSVIATNEFHCWTGCFVFRVIQETLPHCTALSTFQSIKGLAVRLPLLVQHNSMRGRARPLIDNN